MKLILLLISAVIALFGSGSPVGAVSASTPVRLTSGFSQETGPMIVNNKIVYTNYGGAKDIDIWLYDLDTNVNYPLIEMDDHQFASDFDGRWVVYSTIPLNSPNPDYDVMAYNMSTEESYLVAGDSGNQTDGVVSGGQFFYIDGYGCGPLMQVGYIGLEPNMIAQKACSPLNLAGNTLVWAVREDNKSSIYAYNTFSHRKSVVDESVSNLEVPDINWNGAVWVEYGNSEQKIIYKDLLRNRQKVIFSSDNVSVTNPKISWRYVVWSYSSQQHRAGVMGYDLLTGEQFEVFEEGPHQNSRIPLTIWLDQVAWMAWRTGNGDIYTAGISR